MAATWTLLVFFVAAGCPSSDSQECALWDWANAINATAHLKMQLLCKDVRHRAVFVSEMLRRLRRTNSSTADLCLRTFDRYWYNNDQVNEFMSRCKAYHRRYFKKVKAAYRIELQHLESDSKYLHCREMDENHLKTITESSSFRTAVINALFDVRSRSGYELQHWKFIARK